MTRKDIMDLMKLEGVKYELTSNDAVIFLEDATLNTNTLKKLIVDNGGSLPFRIERAEGNLILKRMFLKTMRNFPAKVEGDLDISYNKIQKFANTKTVEAGLIANNCDFYDLDGMPRVGEEIDLAYNHLTHLTHLQPEIFGDLTLSNNRLKTIADHVIHGNLNASNNILVNEPTAKVHGTMVCENNPYNPSDDFDHARW